MNEEIDLRPYVLALIRNWMWIVGAAVLAAAVAFGLSSLLPPTYEARATAVAVGARDVVQFDPRFESVVDEIRFWSAYPELATSDELVQQLLAEVGSDLPEVGTVQGLRGMLEAEPGEHLSLVYLTVRHGDPETAAAVANTWAELFVAWAGDVFRTGNSEQLAFFQNQLEQAEGRLEAAEDALIEFEARNRASILGNRLSALRETEVRYLTEQRSIRFLLEDLRELRDQLAEEPGDGEVSFADQLAALSLQLRAFNAQGQHPLQFQMSEDVDLTGRSRQEQIGYLDTLISSLERRVDEVEARLNELEPQLLALQAEKEAVDVERARLQRARNVVGETQEALARKVAEERIMAESVDQGVRLASRAAVPTNPSQPPPLLYGILGGVLGFSFSAVYVVVVTWWRSGRLLESQREETVVAAT